MKEVKTDDESITFYNKEYDETYHSTTGAVEEAMKKFIEPCKIKELSQKGDLRILDICFGLGYNSAAAIDVGLTANSNCVIKIIGLEKDKKPLEQIKNLNPELKHFSIIKKLAENYEVSEKIDGKIILGDALKTIKQIEEKFNAIFLDPFSPPKNPELWTVEFFKEIIKRMDKNSVLATYSCARKVRDNLKEAGFDVRDGPCVRRKSPSTIAIK